FTPGWTSELRLVIRSLRPSRSSSLRKKANGRCLLRDDFCSGSYFRCNRLGGGTSATSSSEVLRLTKGPRCETADATCASGNIGRNAERQFRLRQIPTKPS